MVTSKALAALVAANLGAQLHKHSNPAAIARDVTLTLAPLLDAAAAEADNLGVSIRQMEYVADLFVTDWVKYYKASERRYPKIGDIVIMLRAASETVTGHAIPQDLNRRDHALVDLSGLVSRLEACGGELNSIVQNLKKEAL